MKGSTVKGTIDGLTTPKEHTDYMAVWATLPSELVRNTTSEQFNQLHQTIVSLVTTPPYAERHLAHTNEQEQNSSYCWLPE